jgi:hypothetical protein
MPERREQLAPPPRNNGWDFRFATSDAVSGWEKLCSAAPTNARVAWERITADPRWRDDRQHPLKGRHETRLVNGESFDQWQYEVTTAGRLWYCIDDQRQTVWLTDAMPGQRKAIE